MRVPNSSAYTDLARRTASEQSIRPSPVESRAFASRVSKDVANIEALRHRELVFPYLLVCSRFLSSQHLWYLEIRDGRQHLVRSHAKVVPQTITQTSAPDTAMCRRDLQPWLFQSPTAPVIELSCNVGIDEYSLEVSSQLHGLCSEVLSWCNFAAVREVWPCRS